MTNEIQTCFICQEHFQPFHEVVKTKCHHKQHVICYQIQNLHQSQCPECHKPLSISVSLPLLPLFSAALLLNHEMASERATYAQTFLSLMLRRFHNSKTWKKAQETIQVAAEQFEFSDVRLPFLNLESLSAAKKEKRKWAELFRQLIGERPQHSERVRTARHYLLEHLSFLFLEDMHIEV